MNILHINLADEAGGAARAALRLHTEFVGMGHSSRMLVGSRRKNLPDVAMVPARETSWQKTRFRLVNRFETATGLQYLIQPWQNEFLRHPYTREAEVINLHNLHSGYFPLRILPKLSRRVPIVWMLHDLWAFSGHCGYPNLYGCERWKTGCGQCPSLGDYPPLSRDTTAFLWRTKQRVYRRSVIALTTPSQWLADAVRQSPLLGHCEVHCIPHGVDTAIYTPSPKAAAREKLGLPADAKIVLFSAFDAFLRRKGGVYLFDALQRLISQGVKDLLLVTVGQNQDTIGPKYGFPVRALGRIRDERSMALCYSAADVYVGPSLAETFGLVFSEAMACATPVIAFAGTGASEVVRHMETGYLARFQDAEDLAHGIRMFVEDADLRETCGRRGREIAEQEYTLGLQARRLVALYEHVIAQRKAIHGDRSQ